MNQRVSKWLNKEIQCSEPKRVRMVNKWCSDGEIIRVYVIIQLNPGMRTNEIKCG